MLGDPLIKRLACPLALGVSLASACRAGDVAIGMTPSTLSLPVDVAQAQGYFADEGVGVRVTHCSSGPRCMQQLFDGSAQMVTVSELPVVSSSFERADYALVATVVTSTGNSNLIGRKSAGVTTPALLVGNRIGVIVGSSSHDYLDAFLLFHDIDPRKVDGVLLSPENIAATVERRQVDAFAGCSRHTGPALKGLDRSLVNTMEGVARWSIREGNVPPVRRTPNYLDFVELRPLRTAVPAALPG